MLEWKKKLLENEMAKEKAGLTDNLFSNHKIKIEEK